MNKSKECKCNCHIPDYSTPPYFCQTSLYCDRCKELSKQPQQKPLCPEPQQETDCAECDGSGYYWGEGNYPCPSCLPKDCDGYSEGYQRAVEDCIEAVKNRSKKWVRLDYEHAKKAILEELQQLKPTNNE